MKILPHPSHVSVTVEFICVMTGRGEIELSERFAFRT